MSKSSTTHYELMVILKPDMFQKDLDAQMKMVRSHVADAGGTIVFEDIWGKRNLAYKIKTLTQGYYATFYFDLAHDQLASLVKELDLEQGIVRKMLVKLPADFDVAVTKEQAKEQEELRAKDEIEREVKRQEALKKLAESEQKNQEREKARADSKKVREEAVSAAAAENTAEAKAEKKAPAKVVKEVEVEAAPAEEAPKKTTRKKKSLDELDTILDDITTI